MAISIQRASIQTPSTQHNSYGLDGPQPIHRREEGSSHRARHEEDHKEGKGLVERSQITPGKRAIEAKEAEKDGEGGGVPLPNEARDLGHGPQPIFRGFDADYDDEEDDEMEEAL